MKQEQSSLEKGTEVFCKQIQQLHFKSIESFEIGCNVALADQKARIESWLETEMDNLLVNKQLSKDIKVIIIRKFRKEFEELM